MLQSLELGSVRLKFSTQALLAILFVRGEISVVEHHARVIFESDNVRGEAIEEVSVVRDDQHAARE